MPTARRSSVVFVSLATLVTVVVAGCLPPSSSSHSSEFIVAVDDTNFNEVVLKSDQPVLVDFWADWCGPCRALAPTINELAEKYQGQAVVAKLDFDRSKKTAARYNVTAIPTVIIFVDGEEVDRLVGLNPKGNYVGKLRKLLK